MAINEKNNATKKRIKESLNQIGCEMNYPVHQDRIMTTKNSCYESENFFEWTSEDTVEELFKDFIHEE